MLNMPSYPISESRQLRRFSWTCQNPTTLKDSNLDLDPPREASLPTRVREIR